jgi:hypothetical protein
MSRESARFQARSAFFGVGFTTAEAEAVVDHPVRRRIIMWLILLGNAGVVTTMGTLLISFAGGGDHLTTVIVLLTGIAVLALLAASRPVDAALTRVIRRALQRWTDLDVRDWSGLLELEGGYTVAELEREDRVEEIDRRAHDEQGDRAHERAVAQQARIEESEEALL